jgi:hypothetical protein
MASFQEVIFNIQNLKSGFLQSDDNKLSDRQVAFIVNYYRAKLCDQQLSKGKTLSNYFYQTIQDVEFEHFKTAIGECILRSKKEIPQVISSDFKDMFTYVGPMDGSKKFDEVNFNDLQTLAYSKYSSKYPKFCIKDRFMYIYLPPTLNLNKLMVRGVFESPEKVDSFTAFRGFNFEYPISGKMLDTIYKMIIDSEFKLGITIPQDEENDGKN